jgi:transposase
MAKYKDSKETCGVFVPVYLKRQIMPGTFEWTLSKLIDGADLTVFNTNYKNDKAGAAAFPPSTLLKAILFCYSRGILSSRKIAEAMKYNMVCKALSSDMEAEHSVIAAFVSGNEKGMKKVFSEVLIKCATLGLIGGDLFAIDGCKLPSNASKEWSGTLKDYHKKKAGWEKLLGKLIEQEKNLDRMEGKKGLNKTCRSIAGDKALAERHIARVQKKLERLDAFLKEHSEDKKGADGNPVQSNITDGESAKIKGPHGYIQGYNMITAADGKNQIITAVDAIGSGPEGETLPGMLDELKDNMKMLTGKEEPLKKALVTTDTNYFSEENLEAAKEKGVEVLIPDQQFRKRDEQFAEQKDHVHDEHYTIEDFRYNEENDTYTCPAEKVLSRKPDTMLRGKPMNKWQASVTDCKVCPFINKCMKVRGNKRGSKKTILLLDRKGKENLSQKMRDKIDNPLYRILYGQRMRIIEPCFADMCYCKGMNRFTLRGRTKVRSQAYLYAVVHNIGKCMKPMGVKYAA